MIIPDAVAASFLETFDLYVANDIGTRLSCSEVNALADLLTALGRPDLASAWIEAHARGDDSGDANYRGEAPP
jgi:hypothetical protein